MNIRKVIKISRPHFWLYEAATFVFFGALLAMPSIALFRSVDFWVMLIYFLIPANILIYGINDIFDYDTDKHNPKKIEYEALVEPDDRPSLYKYILFTNIPFIVYAIWSGFSMYSLLALAVFLFFAVFYSAPPIRAKAIPFLDSIFSAGHYTVTGVFGYLLLGGTDIVWLYVLAGLCWCIAMHAFSAVPDIESDTKAGLQTFATKLGRNPTIVFCAFLYILAGLLVYNVLPLAILLATIYFTVLIYCLSVKNEANLLKIYTYFSYINVITGGILAVSLIVYKFI